MLLIIEALLLISAALVKDHRAAAEPFPLDMQEDSVDDDFMDCEKIMVNLAENLYLPKEKENNPRFMEVWQNDAAGNEQQAAGSKQKAEECEQKASGSKQQASGSKQNAAGSKQQASGSKQNAAGSKQQASGSKQNASGSKQNAAGSKQQASGSKQNASGSKQQASGSKQQASGRKLRRIRSNQQASGSNQQASGSKQNGAGSKQQASGRKLRRIRSNQQASGSKHQASGSKQQASGSKQQASGSKQNAAGSKQQASGSKQQASGSKQQAAEIVLTKNELKAIRIWTGKNTNIYDGFNEVVRSGKQNYKEETYEWYAFHFLLTSAIRKLKNIQTECVTTYRRTHSTFVKENVINTEVRFGSFASSSFDQQVISGFGEKSCFEIYTCFGAHLTEYSQHPKMCEVLIPPYETFTVEEVKEKTDKNNLWCETVYKLRSSGVRSDLRCAIANKINSE